ncbi:MAG: LysM peptidoglycan-binding domain-containing protein [Lachnospiraceae bacterium]|nr:LysM peptidoglycan-binding domain-containing protein [Lachnospiraceae bacterium]
MDTQNVSIIEDNELDEVVGGVGGIIIIPYVVTKKDTSFEALAKKFNTTVSQIKNDNKAVIKGASKPKPGMILQIANNTKK